MAQVSVAQQVREARTTWEGDLQTGNGHTQALTSTAFGPLAVSWRARTERSDGQTSPEELLAAAHASCFSMALASRLAKVGTPAQRLEVHARVVFEKFEAGWRVTRSELTVRGRVPGCDEPTFRDRAEDAKENCPISQALRGNVEMSVEAVLEA